MTPQQYCQQKAAKSGSSFYYSFLSLPDKKREAITALYAFCREVDDIVDSNVQQEIKRTKLNWWRGEIEQLFQGSAQHPITRALTPVIHDFDLPQAYFLEILDGMQMDLEPRTYASFKDLRLYCYRVASVVGLMSAEIFGYHDRITLKYAHDLGLAFQLTNIIRDVYADLLQDRVYLPQDELASYGVSIEDLRNKQCTVEFDQLMQFQINRANEHYQRAFIQLPETDRYSQRTGIIMAEIYHALLDKISHNNCKVLTERIRITPLRKLWIAWQTNRRETRRHQTWINQQTDG